MPGDFFQLSDHGQNSTVNHRAKGNSSVVLYLATCLLA
jgi:hypothetical protein